MKNIDLSLQKKFCTDIREICRPLFDLFKLNFFSHTRISHDGRFVSLMTHPDLTEFYLQMKYPIAFSDGKGIFLNSGCYFNLVKEENLNQRIRNDFQERFNFSYFFYIVQKSKYFDELYSFATNPNNNGIINQYLNHLDLFQHFILYYKDKASSLIKKIKGVTHTPDFFTSQPISPIATSVNFDPNELKKCKENMTFKKVFINTPKGELLLSKREYECLKYLKNHCTQKEIAKHLSLSPRTVETYINNVKYKLNCERRGELTVLLNDLI